MTDQQGPTPEPVAPPAAGPAVPPYQAPGAPRYQPPGGPTPTYQAPGAQMPTYPPPGGPGYGAPGPGPGGQGGTPYPQTTPIGGTTMPPPSGFHPGMPYGAPMPAYAPSPPTNGLAIAGMVLSLIGFVTCGATSVVGLILSVIAKRQITASRGAQSGDGLAIAGIVVGAIFTVLFGLVWFGSFLG